MNSNLKRLLIVDDSEIDREILKNILQDHFELVEAVNGYFALEVIESGNIHIDAMLLDVQMPFIDGFEVMKSMLKKVVTDIPVFLITSEATTDNIHKAARYHFLKGFIKKPYERDYILGCLSKLFNIKLKSDPPPAEQPPAAEPNEPDRPKKRAVELSGRDISETRAYISRLRGVYGKFLSNNKFSDRKYSRVSDITKILLYKYAENPDNISLNQEHIELIGDAAYFYNIGIMTVPPDIIRKQNRTPEEQMKYSDHVVMGPAVLQLNSSNSCSYFVHRCSDICMYHNEIYNNGLVKDENDIFPQIVAVAIEFDVLIMDRPDISDNQFNYVMKSLSEKHGTALDRVKGIFIDCKDDIIKYYKKR